MFDKKWFEKHQNILLWFLNTSLVGRWFRWKLRISIDFSFSFLIKFIILYNFIGFSYSLIKYTFIVSILIIIMAELNYLFLSDTIINEVINKRIIKLTPSSYHWHIEKNLYGFDCRMDDKFAKRIYFGFYWIWWAYHQWDRFAIQYIPVLDLGFADFEPYYSDAGTGNTTVDGKVWRANVTETWSQVRSGAGTGLNATHWAGGPTTVSVNTSNLWAQIDRVIYTIDLSDINGKIQSVIFSIHMIYMENTLGWSNEEAGLIITETTPSSNNNLIASDYGQFSSALTNNEPYNNLSIDIYNPLTFIAGGVTYAEAARIGTGIIRIGAKCYADYTGITPPWAYPGELRLRHYLADKDGTTYDPKLTGTYTVTTEVTALTATYSAHSAGPVIEINWTNPTDEDFAGTMIRRKLGSYPTDETDGTQVYSGADTKLQEWNLPSGDYYYTAFAYNDIPDYSSGKNARMVSNYYFKQGNT